MCVWRTSTRSTACGYAAGSDSASISRVSSMNAPAGSARGAIRVAGTRRVPFFAMAHGACLLLRRPAALVRPLEELDGPLVPLRGRPGGERPQVASLARLRVDLPRVEAVLARLEFADHGCPP